MEVIIGVDPHKASHHAFAVDDHEAELAQISMRASRAQTERLLAWAAPFECRMWAVEGADGMGYLLSQQLVAAGERVVDVPATLAARTRVLGAGRSNKTDPKDARSVALTALRHRDLREVRPVGHREVLRLLAKRNTDIVELRSLVVCTRCWSSSPRAASPRKSTFRRRCVPPRAHPGDGRRADPLRPLGRAARRDPSLDGQLKASHKRIRAAILASGTAVTDLFGVGPILAAMLIGYTGDVARFRDRDHFAAYNGTAPVEFSSGGRTVHRVSLRGNRQLNHALHMAAICQMRQPLYSDGRVYVDRMLAEGKTKREAIRALKRQISNAVYRQLVADARRRAD